MKELSIEEKAKRYDLAIGAAKSIYNNMEEGGNFSGIEDLEVIFPELAEVDGEWIRKNLITFFKANSNTYFVGMKLKDIITWLEKQGEQTSLQTNERAWLYLVADVLTWREGIGQYLDDASVQELAKKLCNKYAQKLYNPSVISNSSNIGNNKQKPDNKVEPEFKVGDWVTFTRKDGTREVLQVFNIIDDRYYFNHLLHSSWSVKECNEKCHLWTIQDAKDGDVLQFKGRPFIYNGYLEEKKYPFAYGGIYLDGSFFISNGLLPWTHSDVYPATKEQHDILFHEMKEAGYEWNAEKKELKKIERKSIEWTEEDTNMFGSIRSTLSMYMNNLSLPKEIRDIHKKELEWFDELYDRGLS